MKLASVKDMKRAKNRLIDGDAMNRLSTDLIAQTIDLHVSFQPRGEGWRVLTGNINTSQWGRVAYRYEITAGQ